MVLQHTRSLARITGSITDHQQLRAMREISVPAGVGKLADNFLESFGYDSDAKLAINHAYYEAKTAEDFCAIVCPSGMTLAESRWLWDYILFTNTD